jgi:hypothetical protein
MTPVLTTERLRPPERPAFPSRVTALVVAAVVGAGVLVMLLASLRGPSFVDELTVVNGTVYRFNVAVSSTEDGSVVQLGSLGRADQNRFQEVIDQGDVWVFHFDYGGFDGGSFTIERDDLEARGWIVDIPVSAEQRLRELGVTPSAEFL